MSKAPRDALTTELLGIYRRLGPAGPLTIASAVLPFVGTVTIISLVHRLSPWLRDQGELGLAIYIGGFAILAGLALLPTQAQTLVGGWAFGFATGLAATMTGVAASSLIAYMIARFASGNRVLEIIHERPKWAAIHDALLGGGFWRRLSIVTLLRVAPTPYALTNMVLSATRVSLVTYIIGTLVGMTPRLAVIVHLGTRLDSLDKADKPWWMWVATIAVTLIVVGIIGHIGNRAVAKVTGVEAPPPAPPAEEAEPE